MHFEAFQFISSIKSLYPHYFVRQRVLEVGSHCVNESIRSLFDGGKYIGIDLSEGESVDIIASGHEFKAPKAFNTVISCECFEHNPYFFETFVTMVENACDGGLVAFTCATTGRPEHGTTRTDPNQSPGSSSIGWDYYRNLTADDFDLSYIEKQFSTYRFFSNESSQDLYFIGFKNGADKSDCARLNQLTSKVENISKWSVVWRSFWHKVNNNEQERFSLFNSFLDAFPTWSFLPSTLYWLIYDLRFQSELKDKLLKLTENYLYFYPDAHNIRCVRAILFLNSKQIDLALFEFESVLKVQPRYFEALHGTGTCYKQKGMLDKAINCYRLALFEKPEANWIKQRLDSILVSTTALTVKS